jgi:uncharacterized protein YqkB
MKQLLSLFLFLLPCLAWAQYPSNGNQKITLGEQTTADGLIWRGVLADTGIITPLSDTSAYIILDTVNHRFYNYNRATNVWSVAGGGTAVTTFSGGTTGLTPNTATSGAVTLGGTLAVANGGTGASSLTPNNYLIRTNSSGIFDTSAVYEAKGNVGINTVLIPNYWVGYTALQIGRNNSIFSNTASGTGSALFLSQNIYNDGDYFRYEADNEGGLIDLRDGKFSYRNAIGGLEDNIATLNTRLIIENTGNVGIGTTSPLALLNVMGTVRINSASAPDANYYLQLENSSSQKAKANAWDTYSDSRIKTNRQPIINAIDKINLLNPTYYNQHDSYVENDLLNIDYNNSYKSLGFIAQEVYEVIPEAVNMGTTNELWAMDYTKLIPILTKAIQEQNSLIKALEQRIINLENK